MSRAPLNRQFAQDGYTPLTSKETGRLHRVDGGYRPEVGAKPAKPPQEVKGQSTSVQPPPTKKGD